VRFKVGEATVNRWVARKRQTGDVAPKPMGGSRGCLVDAEGEELIRSMFEVMPDLTLIEVCEGYSEERGLDISPQTMSSTVRRMGLRRKRGSSGRWLRTGQMSLRREKST